jgi:hypothetical protein
MNNERRYGQTESANGYYGIPPTNDGVPSAQAAAARLSGQAGGAADEPDRSSAGNAHRSSRSRIARDSGVEQRGRSNSEIRYHSAAPDSIRRTSRRSRSAAGRLNTATDSAIADMDTVEMDTIAKEIKDIAARLCSEGRTAELRELYEVVENIRPNYDETGQASYSIPIRLSARNDDDGDVGVTNHGLM